ncbi:putative amine oxidase [copper-containing] [Dreissena polymorpha]|uniref:Amine oxidase n=1 Tax=Dreissena polymorpha TaxID=45954 RepID=A0A9D4K9S2_DREPO|nr:putative amine oxidase [copper-containing] [Dreissena polymorpha]XP_052283704.1 putative amine oxidase [copper-containing] [Dreissena polymorpha]XP_052283705.1 putative amine oxidase [copper-containing] [Dreissena polymorpha]XP_052283706.1 putative amine oxidase [copper-containing] [Dreissena polymorpha]XP_052283707.1 putative amine oxidase [copper-containing] [Dreissena polymorpha]KAH3835608.1 hypothetical protein DPMN_108963 [Dreissena polymorpha]
MSEVTKQRRQIGLCRIIVGVLVLILIAVIIAFAIVVSRLKSQINGVPDSCSDSLAFTINLDPPATLPPFHDLTADEIIQVKEFLYRQEDLYLVRPSSIALNTSYIYSMELHPPNKKITIDYLDIKKAQPQREAKVFIFRGDTSDPSCEEYTVGPLPNPLYKKDAKKHPFRFRPLTAPELVTAITMLEQTVNMKASRILSESYGGQIGGYCKDNCLSFAMITPMSSAVSGQPRTRKMWFWLTPVLEYFPSHPRDFIIRVDVTDINNYFIDRIFHAGKMFRDLDELVRMYDSGSFNKTRIEFPKLDRNLYSSMNRRGKFFPSTTLSPPLQYEPDGKRYSIEGRHVEYMGWSFDVRMSSTSGPQVWDIRYNNKRIVYELSLQEISVFYSANNPALRFADFIDSIALFGTRARSLISGTDCPHHSTYLSATHSIENMGEPYYVDRAFCVFEQNTGIPLRRHLTSSGTSKKVYEGMMDIVLTLRTILTVANYDYIFDFIFHQNGALEVKASSTGYILTTFAFDGEDDYGFRLKDHITGNIHHHMFHFKVDMDINGAENRFETLEITPVDVDNTQWSNAANAKYSQTKLVKKLIRYELEAAVDYDFSTPKYLTFYNKDVTTATRVPRAYRLYIEGMSKQKVKLGSGNEPSISWARHQLAVTKRKEDEPRSSSIYASWDAEMPVVNFQSFLDDNEALTDQDQVAWVTMGMHHIPHMEDLPVTSTVGLDLRFFLLPYNYFDEDPAMGSGDAVRIEPKNQMALNEGLNILQYGKSENPVCMPRKFSFMDDLQTSPRSIFDDPNDASSPIV